MAALTGESLRRNAAAGADVRISDETAIIVWDAQQQVEHFIRSATFETDAESIGFLVPTPTQPELEESGNEAFPYLLKLTEPEKHKVPRPSGNIGCGCGAARTVKSALPAAVVVLQEKLVAGFHAVVLEASVKLKEAWASFTSNRKP